MPKLTKRLVDATANAKSDVFVWDDELAGFALRVKPSGRKTFIIQYRNRLRVTRRITLGAYGVLTVEQARNRAKVRLGDVAAGRDPVAEIEGQRRADEKAAETAAKTVSWVLDQFVARYVWANRLRSAAEVERVLNRYVRPRIGMQSIYALKRSQIVKMLDEIEDDHGPVMADRTLAQVRKALIWYAARDDDFNSPIVRGMARTKPAARARRRMLSDNELRDLWRALDTMSGPYPALVRLLLVTALRRDEVGSLRRQEIADGVWIIPAERIKNNLAHAIPLTATAKAIIKTQPVRLTEDGKPYRDADYVFSRDGRAPFAGWSKGKTQLDRAIAALRQQDGREPMPHWVLHDLRRTARSLMSRAGIPSDIAERVLGHVLPGVRGVYDRYEYLPEKRDALERLAKMIDSIVTPPQGENVVRMHG